MTVMLAFSQSLSFLFCKTDDGVIHSLGSATQAGLGGPNDNTLLFLSPPPFSCLRLELRYLFT